MRLLLSLELPAVSSLPLSIAERPRLPASSLLPPLCLLIAGGGAKGSREGGRDAELLSGALGGQDGLT